jgi:hypothetical protein
VCFTKTFSFTSPEKDFFFYIHGVITSQEKEKRSVLYYSDISDMFPVTGGNFIHTCMHVHIVFAGVRVCVRAGRRVCVSSRYTPTAAEYLPASQPWHVSAPAVLESFPASQSLQEVAPEVAAENFPAKNHRTLTMRESCTCCVSSTGERQRNLLHRLYQSEIHHSTDQLVLLRSTPMTHTTHTPVHCQ